MRPYGEYPHPIGSFIAPVTPPSSPPDGGVCVCVSFSLDWLPYVLGALTQLTLQSTWKVDTADEFRLIQQQATTLITMLATQGYNPMSCCCNPNGTMTRYNAAGVLQVSYDGGATWSDFPQGDTRTYGTYFPPLPLDTGPVTKCAAAENIVAELTAEIDQFADDVAAASSLASLVADIASIEAIFLALAAPETVFAVIFASELLAQGATAIRAAFDSAVWERLKCNIFCNIQSDGTITPQDFDDISAQINEDETGLANVLLHMAINGYGPRGLTNMGRTGGADGDTCDSCECDELWCYEWDFADGDGGWEERDADRPTIYTGGAWVAGPDIGAGYVRAGIKKSYTLTGVSTIEGVWMEFSSTNDGAIWARQISVITTPTTFFNTMPLGTGVVTGSLSLSTADDGRVEPLVDGPDGSVIRITKIRINGSGVNPFGDTNCDT